MGSLPIGLSASRGAAVIGLSKWATPFSVWCDIMEAKKPGFCTANGYEYTPFQGNNATAFGNAFEDAVIELAEKSSGNTIEDREGAYSVDGAEFVTCHIDGRYHGTKCNHEGKTTNYRAFSAAWGEPGTDRVPQEIQVQVQQQMMCNGSDSTIVSVLVFPSTADEFTEQGWQAHHDQLNGVHFLKNHETDQIVMPSEWAKVFAQIGNFHCYEIEAKPDTHKILKELYSEFWNKYVVPCVPPDAVDYGDVKRLFTAPKGVLVVDESKAELMREYREITKEIGASGFLAKRKVFLKNQILKFAMDKTTVMDDDCQEKIIFMDNSGRKVGSYDGKTFRG